MALSRLCVLLVVTVSLTLRVAHLQTPDVPTPRTFIGNCALPTAEELVVLVANSFPNFDSGNTPQMVRIFDSRVLCQASAATRNTVSTFSVVVSYECSGSAFQCQGGTPVNRTDQFQYDCAVRTTGGSGNFFPPAKASTQAGVITENVDPQRLQATPANQCGECSEDSIIINQVPQQPDSTTHCIACATECQRGLGLCLGLRPDQCCSFYENDTCVVNCTAPLVPDAEFDCGCGPLQPDGALVAFSDGTKLGSVATQTCDEDSGFLQPGSTGPVMRTCSRNGWTGADITCQIATCPESDLVTGQGGSLVINPLMPPFNFGATATFSCDPGFELVGDTVRECRLGAWSGSNPTCRKLQCNREELMVTDGSVTVDSDPNPPVFESIATFECNEGFVLSGAETRTCEVNGGTVGWSGENPTCSGSAPQSGGSSSACGTGCIVGIVLAILGVLILAAILAGVAYAVYSYMNHPDTKLAKYDPDNINGVAKDNPLYVDPEAVVGAGDGAEAA